jgi:hypothetical protein
MQSANIFEVTMYIWSNQPIGAEADSAVANKYAVGYGVLAERESTDSDSNFIAEVTFTIHVDPNVGLTAEYLTEQYWTNRQCYGTINRFEIAEIERTGPQFISREQLEYAVREMLIQQIYCDLHTETKDYDINDPEDFKDYLDKLTITGEDAAVLKGLSLTGLMEWLDKGYDVGEQIDILTEAARKFDFDPAQLALNIRDQIIYYCQRIKHSQYQGIGTPGYVPGMISNCEHITYSLWDRAGGPDLAYIRHIMVQQPLLASARHEILVAATTNTIY